jgi:hypothetical protein
MQAVGQRVTPLSRRNSATAAAYSFSDMPKLPQLSVGCLLRRGRVNDKLEQKPPKKRPTIRSGVLAGMARPYPDLD